MMGCASFGSVSCPAPPILSFILGAEPALNNLSKFRGPPHLGMQACPLTILGGRDKSVLITKGIYSYIRHPICLSCILLAFSAAIGFRSTVGLAIAILALIIAYAHASFEERKLERGFGKAYREYRSRVGMFLPKRRTTKTSE